MFEEATTKTLGGTSGSPRIVAVRAFVREDQLEPGPVYEAPLEGEVRQWSRRPIASPLSRYPGYEVRTIGGPAWVGEVVVEVEAADGQVGVGVSIGGIAACFVIEQHLAQFLLGRRANEVATMWDLMWRGSQFYGRRGLVLHAISALDLALWDLNGRLVGQPVYELLGGAVRERLSFYATTPDPASIAALGFIGCKIPMSHGLAAGQEGIRRNVEEFARARDEIGDELFLALDCWMALDVETAVALAHRLLPYRPEWLEECLPPDDYWGYARLRDRFPSSIAVAGGEHEGTRWGFRALSEFGACDLLQPDPTWCGGMTELVRIVDEAEIGGRRVVTHGASSYGMHLAFARSAVPFGECILAGESGVIRPFFGGLFVAEPLPVTGSLELKQLSAPGFGLELNPSCSLVRPTITGRLEV